MTFLQRTLTRSASSSPSWTTIGRYSSCLASRRVFTPLTRFSVMSSLDFRVGHNEVIGVCRVGNEAESLGRDHWSEMLTYPRKPIARWHPLIEVRTDLFRARFTRSAGGQAVKSWIYHGRSELIAQEKLNSASFFN